MRDVLADIERWRLAGQRVALARVVGVDGSSPREPGATMAVSEAGEVAGSVSGGCVEGAVVEAALDSLSADRAPAVLTFGYSDAQAWEVGLTCGGTLRVLVSPTLPTFYDRLRRDLETGRPVALSTVIEVRAEPGAAPSSDPDQVAVGASVLVGADGAVDGSLGNPELDRVVGRDSLGALSSGQSTTRRYGCTGEARRSDVAVFVEAFAPPPQMIIFGAVDFTAALGRVAKVLGYQVTVCDPRSAFATPARFPMADRVLVEWPHQYLERDGGQLGPGDAVCVLTHDHKFDVPALRVALRTRAGYIGAMGSRRTHAERCLALRQAGVSEADLTRIMGPIGVDIGARTPEETAVAICAEIIALRTGTPAPSLRDSQGAIHAGVAR
jgi:xanthine dehydrogenase accessory factor